MLALTIALALPATALAAGSPPTLKTAFTPDSIGVGGTAALSFKITNPNSSGSITGIGFTDTLPSGLVIDDPNGQSGTCGSSGTLTATAGGTTITLAGGKLAAGANCTVSADVTSTTPGAYQNVAPAVSSSDGASNGDTESLTVIGNPTITLSSPANNAVFNYGQKVTAHYGCQEAAGGPGITDCEGNIDDSDTDTASGSALNTTTPGSHTFTVSATSDDGLVVTDTVNYKVRPSNKVVVSALKAHPGGSVSFKLAIPGRGTVQLLEKGGPGHVVFARKTIKPGGKEKISVKLVPSSAGAALLSSQSPVATRLAIEYTPKGGVARTITIGGIKLTS